ncbi:hypothetical protein COO20_16840 [Thalassospira marina]|uniref:Uncharacterized protein n=1 Tax=Thalassospira marina TaxID=2048283 RepID=A0A2N3KQY5_9PROT|nr:hypothetical protein COO20_16840 [Thalassospira marina]
MEMTAWPLFAASAVDNIFRVQPQENSCLHPARHGHNSYEYLQAKRPAFTAVLFKSDSRQTRPPLRPNPTKTTR